MKNVLLIAVGILLLIIILTYISVGGKEPGDNLTCEILEGADLEHENWRDYDSVLVAANTFFEAGDIKKIMQGEHYRKAWATPVKVPVVFLDTLHGGLRILEEGGGRQTHSLDLIGPDSTMYTLRSINKDPSQFISDFVQRLGLENIVEDGISAQHPYGAIAVASLADKAGVLHTHPRVVFIPKQKALDSLNTRYGNRLYLLEYENESPVDWTGLEYATEIIETDDLQELKAELGDKIQIDERALVRVRLFDMLIGDWDRHAEQWGWVIQSGPNKMTAYPVPSDRDNVFYNIGGVIPGIISGLHPHLRPFDDEIDYMPGMLKEFDYYFLYHIPESIFVEEARSLKKALTPSTIDEALRIWPHQIYALDAKEISKKLQNRIEALEEIAVEFHRLIQEKGPSQKPMRGSEDLVLPGRLNQCFECK